MIKLIREGSKKYPWVLKIIMLVLAVTFVIGMGWFGFETSQQPNVVAVIGEYEVGAREFRRAYNNAYEFRKNELEEDVVAADLKQDVLGTLVGRRLWLVAADNFELDVHPNALKRTIMERREFEYEGAFHPLLYQRFLTQNRITPKQFEGKLTQDLRVQKIRFLIQDAVTLNAGEVAEVGEIAARQIAEAEDNTAEAIETIKTRTRLQILEQKRLRALQAFQTAMFKTVPVEIRDEFL